MFESIIWPLPDDVLSKRAAMIPMAQVMPPPAKSARMLMGGWGVSCLRPNLGKHRKDDTNTIKRKRKCMIGARLNEGDINVHPLIPFSTETMVTFLSMNHLPRQNTCHSQIVDVVSRCF